MVMPRGRLLVAEGYKRPAATEYRAVIGEFPPDETTHEANVFVGKDLGLVPLAAWTSSVDEWDHFEWTYQQVIERSARERPLDPDVAAEVNHPWPLRTVAGRPDRTRRSCSSIA